MNFLRPMFFLPLLAKIIKTHLCLVFRIYATFFDPMGYCYTNTAMCDVCFQALQDVTGDEFVAFMKILSGLKQTSTVLGRQQLVDIVAEQADLEKEFEVRSKLS